MGKLRDDTGMASAKTKAPQALSSHGTPSSNNPPPKTALNHPLRSYGRGEWLQRG
jgi:hypothetical protein